MDEPALPLSGPLGAIRGASDTIAAIATPLGRGAIALLRISGPRADDICSRLITPWPTAPRVATLCAIRSLEDGTLMDRALVTRFERGASFTGEPVVEVSTHGGVVTPALVLAALITAGARHAEPGEFTRRAVMNGMLDLAQAEGIGDIIDATSRAGHRAALATLDGGLSRRVLALRDELVDLEALIAYEIDFPEEDDGPVDPARIRDAGARTLAGIDQLLATAPAGELVRAGALVVIAGPPNAGKSSLFNALLGEARALVTALPGTTRDAIEAVVDGRQWPLRLVDTAGLRETDDLIERLGIEVGARYLARADVVLVCGERVIDVDSTAGHIAAMSTASIVRAITKCDLAIEPAGHRADVIATSAETGQGLAEVLDAVERAVAMRHGALAFDAPLLTRARHVTALRQAREEMTLFMQAWASGIIPAPVAAVHLRAAVGALEELVGVVDIEDVLDRVFRSFCVGK